MADDGSSVPDLTPEQQAHMTGAVVRLVFDWLEAVFDRRDLQSVWPLTDGPLRLAMVQSWMIPEFGVTDLDEDRDEMAASFAAATPEMPLWSEFAEWQVERLVEDLPRYVTEAERRGIHSNPSIVGVGLEAVWVAELRSKPLPAGEAIEAFRFLIRHTDDGVRLAGLAGVLPVPGWPPSSTDRLPQ